MRLSVTTFRWSVIAAVALFLWAATTPAQSQDRVGASLGLTKDNNALPIWTKPDEQSKSNLGKVARQLMEGVMIVGHPDIGHGTAWVLSKKHRLLATNAHVADMKFEGKKMMAITNESSQMYEVKKVWYHPGVRRYFKGATSLSIRSTKASDGPVFPNCPDLAVLELSKEGPDLPVEFTMASPAELKDLLGQASAVFGYPGHDSSWPRLGQTPVATLHQGMVSRLTDFHNGTASERQKLQYTMATWSGFSGSPVFLPNGHVVAVHNMARTIKSRAGVLRSIAHGVRIDCLWELLVHHGLQDKVSVKIDKSRLDIDRWLKDDARDALAVKVKKLVDEGNYLIYTEKKFVEGAEKCSEAIKLVPDYARAYEVRSGAYINYYISYHERISREVSLKQLDLGLRDWKKFSQLNPSEPRGIIGICRCYSNMGNVTRSNSLRQRSLSILNELLTSENLSRARRAEAHSSRGVIYANLGYPKRGLADHNEAIRLAPKVPQYYNNRAGYWNSYGDRARQQADNAKAKELRDKQKRSSGG